MLLFFLNRSIHLLPYALTYDQTVMQHFYNNSKLLADQFAAKEYRCVLLDTVNGDPFP
jgi:hypothetical protein